MTTRETPRAPASTPGIVERNWIGLGLVSVLLVGLLDEITGHELSFVLFYLAPVGLWAWYGGRRPGVAMAAGAVLTWLAADLVSAHEHSSLAVPVWNGLVRLSTFLAIALGPPRCVRAWMCNQLSPGGMG